MKQSTDFKIGLEGVAMNNITLPNSQAYSVGFVDSGTTFTYLPNKLYNDLEQAFKQFCAISADHCMGRQDKLCFSYSEHKFPEGPIEFFKSFPVLQFKISTGGEPYEFHWFPSEYLYRESESKYCLAAESYYRGDEILMGGTFMRQHNFIFDVENNRLGLAHATCHEDPN